MKQILSLLIVVCTALTLLGCAPTTPQEATNNGQAQDTVTPTTPVVEETEEIETPPEDPIVEVKNGDTSAWDALPSDVVAILDKGVDRKETGYSYLYQRLKDDGKISGEIANNMRVIQKGEVKKATLSTYKQLEKDYWVYFFIINEGNVNLYCEKRECNGVPNAEDSVRSAKLADYNFLTPSDWLETMESVEKLGEENLDNRATFKLGAEVDGQPVKVWVDRFSGLPTKVESGTFTYLYTDMNLGVKDSELQP